MNNLRNSLIGDIVEKLIMSMGTALLSEFSGEIRAITLALPMMVQTSHYQPYSGITTGDIITACCHNKTTQRQTYS
jgi:hypothetical protein